MRLIYDSTSRSSFPQKRESRIIPNIIYRFLLSQERQRVENYCFSIFPVISKFNFQMPPHPTPLPTGERGKVRGF
jgi:hypothetical protein